MLTFAKLQCREEIGNLLYDPDEKGDIKKRYYALITTNLTGTVIQRSMVPTVINQILRNYVATGDMQDITSEHP